MSKKIISTLSALALTFSGLAYLIFQSPVAQAANVIQNSSSETAGVGGAGDAANWTEGSLHARASDKFNTGAWSLKSTFRGAGTDTRQTVSISTNTTYSYSGYIWRTNTVGGACMDMNDIVGELTLCATTAGSWQFKSGTWGSGSNSSVTLRMISDGSPTGDIWFDDISLDAGGPTNTPTNTATPIPSTNTPTNTSVPPTSTFTSTPGPTNTFTNTPTPTNTFTPAPPTNTPTNTPIVPTNTPTNTPASSGNVVQNPSFEIQGASSADAASWTEGANHARANDKFNTGAWSLKSTFRGVGTDTRQTVSIVTNTTYIYSGYVWRTNTVGSACMDMNDIIGELTLCTATAGSWQFVTGTWGSGSNTSLTLRLITDASPTGDIWFDDIGFTPPGPPPTSTNTPTPGPSPTPPPSGAAGDILDFFAYNAGSGGNRFIFTRVSQAAYTFVSGDFIEYDVKLITNVAAAGGLDIYNTDGSTFRGAAGWQDQNGLAGAPTADLTSRANNVWYHRKLAVPGAMVGKTAAQWTLAGENDTNFLTYRAQYDNLQVTNGAGVIKKNVFASTADFKWDSLFVSDRSGGNNQITASVSPVDINGGPSGNPHVIVPVNPSDDVVVANFVVTDAPYNADTSGVNDATNAIQQALTDAYNAGGGVVWMPAGKYKVTGSIHIPSHVTLRGDWRNPDSGTGSYGAVILANVPSGPDSNPGLFRIWGSAGVKGLTVYYPNQSLPSPTSYPYTFEILGRYLGEDGYMAGSVQNVTLLNSYKGVSAGKDNTHELHAIRNVKGTVLALGMYLQDTADVGKVERITFNNSYWANLDASVSASKPLRADIDNWTRANGIGLQLGGVEWDQLTQISLSDYQTGVTFVAGRRIGATLMMYDLTIQSSNIGMKVNFLDNRIGVVVSNCTIAANVGSNPIAVQVVDGGGASVIFNNCTIGGGASKAVEVTGNTMVSFHNSTFDNWTGTYALTANAGTLVVEGCTFVPTLSASKKGINLLSGLSSAALLGNAMTPAGSADFLTNSSTGDVKRQDTGYSFEAHGQGAYPWRPNLPRPTNNNFYNVRLAPYNAVADGATDATTPIQNALNDAGAAGGGTVYLPPGLYRINGHLNVPAGVELRGADDAPHRAMLMGRGTGTVLYAIEGHGTASPDTATPFIMLNGINSGVRGLSIHYPNQCTSSSGCIVAYPWSIRGSGDTVYAYDIGFTNTWRGVDFATNPTNNHYVNQVVGLALKEGIRVGNASEGWVEDNLFNINAWARANGLPNILDETNTMFPVAAGYARANLRAFVVTGGAANEHVLSNFVYGAQTGHTFESTANAAAFNIAADGSVNTLNFTGTGATGVKVINVEGCGCGLGGVAVRISGGTAKVWNVVTMEGYAQAINISGGTSVLQGMAFHHSLGVVSSGTASFNGVLFRDGGTDVAINGGTVNLWGNIGGDNFNWSGTPGSASNNIRR